MVDAGLLKKMLAGMKRLLGSVYEKNGFLTVAKGYIPSFSSPFLLHFSYWFDPLLVTDK
jgi:hypothetical protein